MTKYMRSRHIPLTTKESTALNEEFDVFLSNIEESGSLLKSLRESKGWNEAELGQKVGIDAEYIAMMENGTQPIPLDLAKKFGEIFDCDYHFFL